MKWNVLTAFLATSIPTILPVTAVLGQDSNSGISNVGSVSAATLDTLGLGQLEVLPDSEGMNVRGRTGSNAFASGASLTIGHLVDIYNPGNFLIATDTNSNRASVEIKGASVFSGTGPTPATGATNVGQSSAVQALLLTSSLINGVPTPTFSGAIAISAGGFSSATVP